MRLCIVGNGPSAVEHGVDIDACDFVVRMCGWWKSRPGDSGKKIDAYAWFGSNWQAEIPEPWANQCFQHWFTLPAISRTWPPNVGQCGLWQMFVEVACLRPIYWMPERQWQIEAAALLLESKRTGFHVPPSTGFTAVDLALHLYRPEEVVLYGFDATFANRPGWGDENPEWNDGNSHDLAAEKRLIARLADTGEFLGERWPTKVTWPNRPNLEETA